MKLLTTIFATLLLLLSSTFTAKVVRVSDGDTITVLTDKKEQIRIRLEGIDCLCKLPFFWTTRIFLFFCQRTIGTFSFARHTNLPPTKQKKPILSYTLSNQIFLKKIISLMAITKTILFQHYLKNQ